MGQAAIPAIISIAQHPGFRIGLAAIVGMAAISQLGQKGEGEKVKIGELGKFNFEEECCCGQRPKCERLFFIKMKSKKEAYEAALHYRGSHGVMYHAHNSTDNFPHYHPTYDYEGKKKIPGVHFQFPR